MDALLLKQIELELETMESEEDEEEWAFSETSRHSRTASAADAIDLFEDDIWNAFVISSKTIDSALEVLPPVLSPRSASALVGGEALLHPDEISAVPSIPTITNPTAPYIQDSVAVNGDVKDFMESILEALLFRFALGGNHSQRDNAVTEVATPAANEHLTEPTLQLFDENACMQRFQYKSEEAQSLCERGDACSGAPLDAAAADVHAPSSAPMLVHIHDEYVAATAISTSVQEAVLEDARMREERRCLRLRRQQELADQRERLAAAALVCAEELCESAVQELCVVVCAGCVGEAQERARMGGEEQGGRLLGLVRAEQGRMALEDLAAAALREQARLQAEEQARVQAEAEARLQAEAEAAAALASSLAYSLVDGWRKQVRDVCAALVLDAPVQFDPAGMAIAASLFSAPPTSSSEPRASALLLSLQCWRTSYTSPSAPARTLHKYVHPAHIALDAEAEELVYRYSNGGDPATVTSLDLSVDALSSVAFLRRFPNLRSLDLSVNKLTTADDLAHLTTIEELSIRDNQMRDVAAVSCLSRLRHLQMDMNLASDVSFVSGLVDLVSLNCSSNRLSDLPPLPPSIERLELFHNSISTLPLDAFSFASRLLHLDLGRNQLSHIDSSALLNCPLLTQLILSQNKLTVFPMLRLPMLRLLWLSGNNITSLAMHDSHEMFLPMLEKLYLQSNVIASIDAQFFCPLPLLSELDLSFNSIHSVDDVSALRLTNLHSLKMHDNPIGAEYRSWCSDNIRLLCTLDELPVVRSAPIDMDPHWLGDAERAVVQALQSMATEQNVLRATVRHVRSKASATDSSRVVALMQRHVAEMRDSALFTRRRFVRFHVFAEEEAKTDAPPLNLQNPTLTIEDTDKDDASRAAAATSISRVFRGHSLRARLRKALSSVAYAADVIDVLQEEELAWLASLTPAHDGWMDSSTQHLVYGDHRRRSKLTVESSLVDLSDGGTEQFASSVVQKLSRPSSSATDRSILSASSEARSEVFDQKASTADETLKASSEWGTSDPVLLATLLRRNKRMKTLQNAKDHREKEKDPQYRLEKFARNANIATTYTPYSSGTVPRRSSVRAAPRRSKLVPAWATIGEDSTSQG